MDYQVAIIGGGPGGHVAAEKLAAAGQKVCIIERAQLGGTCLNCGCIPTKTYLAAAKLYYQAKDSADFGVTTDTVHFDFARLFARKEKVLNTLRGGIVAQMKKHNVEIITAEAKLSGRHEVIAGERRISAENIIVATGSRSTLPPIKGSDLPHVFDSQRLLAKQDLPANICIIGGGVIGIEFACFYASLGVPVTVVEFLDEICSSLDSEIAKILRAELTKKGITFYLGRRVSEIKERAVLTVDKDSQVTEIPAQSVLIATGRRPNLENIGLETVGITFDQRGIKVDSQLRTNISNIYAVGDCNGMFQLAHVASRQGEVVANVIMGMQERMSYDAVPAVVYTSPEVAVLGLSEDDAKKNNIAIVVNKAPLGISGRFVAENDKARGMIKVIFEAKDDTLLGVHIIGNYSSEVIWGVAMLIGQKREAIRRLIFPHPTICEALKLVV